LFGYFGGSSPVEKCAADVEKLERLRELDTFRRWFSLDDQRRCLSCGRIINGHQVEVNGGDPDGAPLRLNCPTANCEAVPLDWAIL